MKCPRQIHRALLICESTQWNYCDSEENKSIVTSSYKLNVAKLKEFGVLALT